MTKDVPAAFVGRRPGVMCVRMRPASKGKGGGRGTGRDGERKF